MNLISQRATIQGFLVCVLDPYPIFATEMSLNFPSVFISTDFESEYPVAIKDMTVKLLNGSLKRKFHIVEGGIEQAPVALPMLFNGGNTGKL
jgi:NADPH-dependent curcumin reductase CurA